MSGKNLQDLCCPELRDHLERSIRTVTNSVHNFHVGPFLSVSEDLKETGTQFTLRIRRQISQDFFFFSIICDRSSVCFNHVGDVFCPSLCIKHSLYFSEEHSLLFFTNAKSYLIGLIDRLINLLVFY